MIAICSARMSSVRTPDLLRSWHPEFVLNQKVDEAVPRPIASAREILAEVRAYQRYGIERPNTDLVSMLSGPSGDLGLRSRSSQSGAWSCDLKMRAREAMRAAWIYQRKLFSEELYRPRRFVDSIAAQDS